MDAEELEKRTKELKRELRQQTIGTTSGTSSALRSGDTSRTSQGIDGYSTTNSSTDEPGIHAVPGQSQRPTNSDRLSTNIHERSEANAGGSGQGNQRPLEDRRNVRSGMGRLQAGDSGNAAEADRREQVKGDTLDELSLFKSPPGAFFYDETKDELKWQHEETGRKGTISKGNGKDAQGISSEPAKRKRGRPRKIIPVEEFKQKQQEAKAAAEQVKQTTKQVTSKLPKLFKNVKVLSEKEAHDFLEPMQEVFMDVGLYLDQYIWARTNDSFKTPIWSDLSNEEASILAVRWIKTGQRVPAVATATRAAVESHDYIQIAEIIIPRALETRTRLANVPKRERKRRNPHETQP